MGWADGDPLQVRIRVAFGADLSAEPATWSWTDLTAYWWASDPIELEWGRQSSATRPESSTCALTLRNSDGRFTVENAAPPYWPHVRTWTPVSVDVELGDGTGWHNRHSGYVRSWSVTWPGRSGKLAVARIESVGILGRLGRGSPPTRSPMNRIVASISSGLLAYWPCEDEADATQAASGIRGAAPMRVAGNVRFAAGNVDGGIQRHGTKPLPLLADGGTLSGRTPAGTSSPVAWTLEAFWQTGNPVGEVVLLRWTTPAGTFVRWDYVDDYNDVYGTYLVAYTASGAPTVLWSVPTRNLGPFHLGFSAVQNGGSIDVTVRTGRWRIGSATVTGTLARIDTIALNPDQRVFESVGLDFVVGHLRVWDSPTSPLTYLWVNAHPGEQAHLRLARLCAEDGIVLSVPTVPDDGATAMGIQPDGTPLDLYQQCEHADLGIIYESGHGLAYLPRWSRYSAPPALIIDAADRQLGGQLTPAATDQQLRNHWTVTRIGGSSAVAADEDSITQRGLIPSSLRLNLASDDQLQGHADWRLWMYGQTGTRYRLTVPLHTRSGRALTADWVACQPGSRVQVVNAPSAAKTDVIDQTIVYARETISGRRSWWAELATEPADRWEVGVWDDPSFRWDSRTTTLIGDHNATGTSIRVTVAAAQDIWSTTAIPYDWLVGGERITVTSMSTPSGSGPWTQTANVVRAVNGVSKPQAAGTPVRLADAKRWGL